MSKKRGTGKTPHLGVSKLGWDLTRPSNKRRGMERQMMRDAIREYAKSQKMTLAEVYAERLRNVRKAEAARAAKAEKK